MKATNDGSHTARTEVNLVLLVETSPKTHRMTVLKLLNQILA